MYIYSLKRLICWKKPEVRKLTEFFRKEAGKSEYSFSNFYFTQVDFVCATTLITYEPSLTIRKAILTICSEFPDVSTACFWRYLERILVFLRECRNRLRGVIEVGVWGEGRDVFHTCPRGYLFAFSPWQHVFAVGFRWFLQRVYGEGENNLFKSRKMFTHACCFGKSRKLLDNSTILSGGCSWVGEKRGIDFF